MLGFLKKKPAPLPRGHLRVRVNEADGSFAFEVERELVAEELEPAFDAALSQVRDLTEQARTAQVDGWIREIQKEMGVLDKLMRKKSRWESEARNVVPTEMFVGAAEEVEVTLDGELGFVTVQLGGTAPAAAATLVLAAIEDAQIQARARWTSCIQGALEELPEEDKAEVFEAPEAS